MLYKTVYLAGGMTGLTFEESNKWRVYVKRTLTEKGYKVINPNNYYSPHTIQGISNNPDREVRNFDIGLLKKSDFVIVNFNAPESIGTAQELAIAYENCIPVIGLNEEKAELHPWLTECCEVILSEMSELIDYVTNYYN